MAFSEALDTFVWVLTDGQSSLLMFDLAISSPLTAPLPPIGQMAQFIRIMLTLATE